MENQQRTRIQFDKFTWTIENFSRHDTAKLRSKPFKINGYKWRIHVYPLRKGVDHFSLYLMVADSLPPYGWSRNTYFKLALINQVDVNKSVVKETQQKFNGGYRSWGSLFVNLNDFYDLKQGFLVKNRCIIEAHVCVSEVAVALHQIQDNNLTRNVTPTHESSSDDQAARRPMKQEEEGTEFSDEALSSPTYESSQTEDEAQGSDLTLSDLIDLESLGPEDAAFVPLLEEVCIWHPSLIQSQRKRTRGFKLWAFTSLGQVLHLLKTKKVKDMNEDDCYNHLQDLWEELVSSSGFDLNWLQPYVQSALGVKANLKRAEQVRKLKDNAVALEFKMKKLRGELAEAEADLELARRELVEVEKSFQEMDMDAGLGYAMF